MKIKSCWYKTIAKDTAIVCAKTAESKVIILKRVLHIKDAFSLVKQVKAKGSINMRYWAK